MIINSVDPALLAQVVSAIQQGGVVALPSDTVYGLCADATNPRAVEKLIALKERPPGKPISVFVRDWEMLESCVVATPAQRTLLQTILPGPYTAVLPSKHTVVSALESESGTLGVRLIDAPVIQAVLAHVRVPLTATSANRSGTPPHRSSHSFEQSLSASQKSLIDIIYPGTLPRREPSAVIDFTAPTPTVLRAREQGKTHHTKTAQETMQLAQKSIQTILTDKPHTTMVIYVHGELGAGKTHFVKGIAQYFDITHVTSPTYLGYQIYENSRVRLIHVDLYNTHTTADRDALHLEQYMTNSSPDIPTIMCIEWGEMGTLQFPGRHVYIEYTGPTTRAITLI